MSDRLPLVYLARHEETAWTITEQHTGPTDLSLTEYGERRALRLGERLKELVFAKVFTSPLQRARRTCELVGFGSVAEIESDLVERNYSEGNHGQFEGHRGADIRFERRDSNQFRDGCPEGETPEQ
jgi:broad specificity phosphatase PhoE